MKGLERIPSTENLLLAYNELQGKAPTEDQLIQYFQWVRFDPRLGEILVTQLRDQWSKLDPYYIYKKINLQIWPAVMGVLLDTVQVQLPAPAARDFAAWKKCILHKIPKPSYQSFFIGLTAFGGKIQRLQKSNKIFRKWDFYGEDLFLNKASEQNVRFSTLSSAQRKEILNKYIQNKPLEHFTVSDYLEALGSPVSRRLAELDLTSHPLICSKGHTRCKVYWAVK